MNCQIDIQLGAKLEQVKLVIASRNRESCSKLLKRSRRKLNEKGSTKKVPVLGLVKEKEEVTNKTPLLDNPDRDRSEMEEKIDRLLDSMAQLNSNVNKIEEKFNITGEIQRFRRKNRRVGQKMGRQTCNNSSED